MNLLLPSPILTVLFSHETEAFEGKTANVKCGTSLPNISLNSQKAKDLIGADNVNYLKSLNGKPDGFGQIFHF